MKPFHEIVKRALVTEKSVRARALSCYTFEVDSEAGKGAIAEAMENFFKVKVVSVRTMKVPGRRRRFGRNVGKTSAWKKAIVTLAEGQKIEMLEAE